MQARVYNRFENKIIVRSGISGEKIYVVPNPIRVYYNKTSRNASITLRQYFGIIDTTTGEIIDENYLKDMYEYIKNADAPKVSFYVGESLVDELSVTPQAYLAYNVSQAEDGSYAHSLEVSNFFE